MDGLWQPFLQIRSPCFNVFLPPLPFSARRIFRTGLIPRNIGAGCPAYRMERQSVATEAEPAAPPRRRRKLDNFNFLLLDDLGCLPQGAEESEVLFTLIAERYERRSLGITSNLVFSKWERIFTNPMATAAALGRVVHHSVILEFAVPSYRTDAAQQRGQEQEVNRQE